MTDEKLIEEARRAIHGAIPGSGDYDDWVEAIPHGLDMLGDIARAVLTVFEKPQGEPSDAQVDAALLRFSERRDETWWDAMRAALRAALTVGEVR